MIGALPFAAWGSPLRLLNCGSKTDLIEPLVHVDPKTGSELLP
jgi:hypothetical protein